MNDTVTIQQIPHGSASLQQRLDHVDEPRAYLDKAPRMLALVRQRILELDTAWHRQRTELINRLNDDLARLDAQHDRDVQSLASLAHRIEATRET